MKKTTFTDTMIRKLKPADTDYTRSEGNGFTIRVLPSGVKTWQYIYQFDGRRRKMSLGHYDPEFVDDKGRGSLSVAREKFEYARRKVENGIDPLAEQDQNKQERILAPTVEKLIEEYIERHAKRFKRSWEKDEAILNRDVVPLWGKRKAADIKKRDVVLLLEGIVDRGSPAMANNCFQIVRKMFNWAVEKDILTTTPCLGVKLPSPKVARERALSESEINVLWCNMDKCPMSDEIRRALKLILVTAQRPGEVIGMRSREIDGRWWTVPAERAKNGKTHRVYLTDTALGLIGPRTVADQETGETKPKEYVFPTPSKKKRQAIAPQAMIVALNRAATSPVLDPAGKPAYGDDGKLLTENLLGVDDFTAHDLRRTAATFMAKAGEMDEVIDAVLNHAKKGVIKVYNQYRYDKEKQTALETWERKLTSIVSDETAGKVVSIATRRSKKGVEAA